MLKLPISERITEIIKLPSFMRREILFQARARMKKFTTPILLIAAAACRQQPATNPNTVVAVDNRVTPSRPVSDSSANATLPSKRTPLEEASGAIDPKSTEAAGQVIQQYGALIEQDRFTEAAKFWRDAPAASAFLSQLRARGLKHLEIGNLGQPEGAAGSIYVTMPVIFYEADKRSSATVTLRRVNDVPGATPSQLDWRIYSASLKPAP